MTGDIFCISLGSMQIRTSSLSPINLSAQGLRLKQYAVVAADIDYTLVDIGDAHTRGVTAIGRTLGTPIAKGVDHIYRTMLAGKRHPDTAEYPEKEDYRILRSELGRLSIDVNQLSDHGLAWSRELFIIVAARRLAVAVTPDNLKMGRDAYWNEFGSPEPYTDALQFILRLQQQGTRLVLMTASDCVLKIINGDATYEPKFSRSYKMRRLRRLGFAYDEIVIGDPHDKPSKQYFDTVVETASRVTEIEAPNVLFVGDSFANDLAIPNARGYDTVHIVR